MLINKATGFSHIFIILPLVKSRDNLFTNSSFTNAVFETLVSNAFADNNHYDSWYERAKGIARPDYKRIGVNSKTNRYRGAADCYAEEGDF